jgi:proteasome lid subunit RPN8/RPN11
MTNVDNSNTHFMMEPKEQFATVKDIRSSGLEMLAIYHSHPETPARPSAEDIKLALTPNVIYVIISLLNQNGSAIKGFHISGNNVTEVPIKILEK